jgi:hypothetical protein
MGALWFKIFFGTHIYQADEKLNNWLHENPEYEVVDYRVFHEINDIHNHMIMITYREKEDGEYDQSRDAESAESKE